MRKKHHILTLPSLSFMRRMLRKGPSEEEQKEWEDHLQDDPFLSDAMEGLELLKDSPTLTHRLNRIDRKTQQRIRQVGRRGSRDLFGAGKKNPFTTWQYMGAAAATFGLLLATVYMFQMMSNEAAGDTLLANAETGQEMEEAIPPFLDSTNVYRRAFELVLPPVGLFPQSEGSSAIASAENDHQISETMEQREIAFASRMESTEEVIPAPTSTYPYPTLYGEIDEESAEIPEAYGAQLPEKESDIARKSGESQDEGNLMDREQMAFSELSDVSRARKSMAHENTVRRKGDRDYANEKLEEEEIQYERLMTALESYKQEELVSALEELEIILGENPRHVAANYYKGLILADLGHSEKAVMSFNQVLESPEAGFYREKALWALANELDRLDRDEEALGVLDELAELKGAFRKPARKFKKEIISRSAEKE